MHRFPSLCGFVDEVWWSPCTTVQPDITVSSEELHSLNGNRSLARGDTFRIMLHYNADVE
jgi:hypothetical protein